MTAKQFIFSALLAISSIGANATIRDSIMSDDNVSKCPSKEIASPDTAPENSFVNYRYNNRIERIKNRWSALVPNKAMMQYAGDIGMISLGIGWEYGRHDQWETYIIVGFLPKKDTRKSYRTFTLKELYTPWDIRVKGNFNIQPLFVTMMMNTIFGEEFWVKQPERYPSGYYTFATKLRFHLGIGQKISLNIPYKKRRWYNRIALYYEVSTCDLYLRQKILNKSIPLKDIICLGIGVQYTLF